MDLPEEIYERPTSEFVADFIGETNLIEGKVISLEPQIEVEVGTGLRVLVSWAEPGLEPGDPAVVSIRPEKLNLFELHETYPSGPTSNVMRGKVQRLVYVGTDTRHTIDLDCNETVIARVQNFYIDEEPWEVGEPVLVQWDAAHGRVFKR